MILRYDANPLKVARTKDSLVVFWNGRVEQPSSPVPYVVVKPYKTEAQLKEAASHEAQTIQEIDLKPTFKGNSSGKCETN